MSRQKVYYSKFKFRFVGTFETTLKGNYIDDEGFDEAAKQVAKEYGVDASDIECVEARSWYEWEDEGDA